MDDVSDISSQIISNVLDSCLLGCWLLLNRNEDALLFSLLSMCALRDSNMSSPTLVIAIAAATAETASSIGKISGIFNLY